LQVQNCDLRQIFSNINLYTLGDREDFISEDLLSEWQ
jgi:hypothetical protein